MRRWRVYYDDGSIADNFALNHTVPTAPGVGVLVIVQEDNDLGDIYSTGRELLFDADYYCWRVEEERWFKCDIHGLFDYLAAPGWKRVLAGRTAPRSAYRAALINAQNDPSFSPRSSAQANEQRLRELTT